MNWQLTQQPLRIIITRSYFCILHFLNISRQETSNAAQLIKYCRKIFKALNELVLVCSNDLATPVEPHSVSQPLVCSEDLQMPFGLSLLAQQFALLVRSSCHRKLQPQRQHLSHFHCRSSKVKLAMTWKLLDQAREEALQTLCHPDLAPLTAGASVHPNTSSS